MYKCEIAYLTRNLFGKGYELYQGTMIYYFGLEFSIQQNKTNRLLGFMTMYL